MEYKRVLAILGVVMVSLGSAMAIWPTFFGGFTGWAVTEGVERLCRQYEEVKMSLVRLNGSMNLGVGVMALVVRDVADLKIQRRILLTFMLGTGVGLWSVVGEQLSGNVTDFGKGAVVFNAAILALLAAGVFHTHGVLKERGSE